MPPEFPFKQNPRRWFLAPFLAGIALMLLSILFWRFPRLLLFLVCLPLFLSGLGLALFGLDLWRGVSHWRETVRTIRVRYWRGDKE